MVASLGVGKGIYTAPTPLWMLKHIPWSVWGLGNTPVRIPIKLNSYMITSEPLYQLSL